MEHLMTALMLYASSVTGLPVPDRLPTIVRKDACEIEKIVMQEHAKCEAGHGVVAAYGPGVIFLQRGWELSDVYETSALLHELVHHMQHEAMVNYRCRGERERVAYEAQMEFLSAPRQNVYEVMNLDAFTVSIVTSCMY